MAEKKTTEGLSAAEREAVKDRAKELRAQAKAGKNREAGTKAVLAAIADMDDADTAIAEGLHAVVADVAPDLVPKTFYGMPAYADADGKVVVFVQAASKFQTRYATIGFEAMAHLDDGDMWPTGFAVTAWNATVEKRVRDLVKRAVG